MRGLAVLWVRRMTLRLSALPDRRGQPVFKYTK